MKGYLLYSLLMITGSIAQASSIDSLKIALEYQTNTEERGQTLYHIAYSYLTVGDSSGLSYLTSGINLFTKNKDEKELAPFYYLKGYYHRNFDRNHSQAFISFSIAEKLYEAVEDLTMLNRCKLALAEYQFKSGNYKLSKIEFREVEATCIELGAISDLGYVHEQLGYLYKKENDLTQAISEFEISQAYFAQINDHPGELRARLELIKLRYQKGFIQEAEATIKRTLSEMNDKSGPIEIKDYFQFLLGKIHQSQGDLLAAEIQLSRAYQNAFSRAPYDTETFRMARTLGQFLHDQGQTERAIQLLESQAEHLPHPSNEVQLSALSLLGQLYESQSKFTEALATERRVSEGKLAMATAEAQADQARQMAEITLAQKILADEEEVAHFEAKSNQQAWAMGGVIVAFLMAMGWLFWLKEKHRKQAEANSTHWEELGKRYKALEDALSMMG
ncbi:MAG TPA: hypothetical protein DCE41_13915 [Cytophagales bacterium]|nr:hypothetical protein [Cytophagales bacterium]HAA21673.1 hypothetical protein [Cytophagales bacterium]